MSDKSHRSPPPLPPGKSTSTGDSQAQKTDASKANASKANASKANASKANASKADASKTNAVKVPAGTRSRTRSGAMRATTRPDNPLAVFKAQQSLRPQPEPARTAPRVDAPAPPVPRAAPRVP